MRDRARLRLPVRAVQGRLLLGLLLVVVQALTTVAGAWCLGGLVEYGLLSGRLVASVVWAALTVGAYGAHMISAWLAARIMYGAATESVIALRRSMLSKVVSLPQTYHDTHGTGDTVTRLAYDAEAIERFLGHALVDVIAVAINLVVVVISCLLLDWRVASVLAVGIFPALLLAWASRRTLRVWNRRMADDGASTSAVVLEHFAALNLIHSYALDPWSKSKVGAAVASFLRSALGAADRLAVLGPLIHFACFVPVILIVVVLAPQVLSGAVAIATFVACIKIAQDLIAPVRKLSHEIQNTQVVLSRADRVAELLREPDAAEELDDAVEAVPSGGLSFSGVRMDYGGHNVALKNASFSVEAGEWVGIVGRTGSGKSTVGTLLHRLYDFQDGDIQIGGVSIRRLSSRALRRSVGVVPQNPPVVQASVRENLDPEGRFPDGELMWAVTRTGWLRIMLRRGLSLDSPVAAQRLSAAERGLLAVSRILVSQPPVVVLDEVFSDLDVSARARVWEALLCMRGRCTMLVISHDRSALRYCDRVLHIEKGKVHSEPHELSAVALEDSDGTIRRA